MALIQFVPEVLPNEVVIFGCGGTGSRLIPKVAQFLRTLSYILNPKIYLFDFDRVEDKNLVRQNFIASDVGKFKSEVMASRYSKAYGIEILASTEDITKSQDSAAAKAMLGENTNRLYIFCVDSISARQGIVQKLIEFKAGGVRNSLLIDTGNEDLFGQVKLSGFRDPYISSSHDVNAYKSSIEKLGMVPYTLDVNFLPFDDEYFLGMRPAENKASCADLDQTMAINDLVASTTFGIIQNLYFRRPIRFHRINISLDGGSFTQPITENWLEQVATWKDKNEEFFQGSASAKSLEDAQSRYFGRSDRFNVTDFFNTLFYGMKQVYDNMKAEEARAAEKARKAAAAAEKREAERKRRQQEEVMRREAERIAQAQAQAQAATPAPATTPETPAPIVSETSPSPEGVVDRIRTEVRAPAEHGEGDLEATAPETPEQVVQRLWAEQAGLQAPASDSAPVAGQTQATAEATE